MCKCEVIQKVTTNRITVIPENAKAVLSAVSETTEAELLASLKVSQNKSKVLHAKSTPHSEHECIE